MKLLVFLACLLSSLLAFPQKLENLRAAVQGEKIIVTYDISQGYPGDKFDISLYASHNGFTSPMQRVTGDVGRGQTPGKDKRIEVDAKNEIGKYKGELSFEVRAEVIAAFALTNKFASAKRGKSVSLNWRGGSKNQDVKIELLKAGTAEVIAASVSNNGTYQWTIPAKQKPGKDYQVRLVNGRETVTTDIFAIKHKVPTLVKILPVAVIGAVILFTKSPSPDSDNPSAGVLATPPNLGLD